MASYNQNTQKHPLEIYKSLGAAFDAASGTTAQKQVKAVDEVFQSPVGRKWGKVKLEEAAAGVTP